MNMRDYKGERGHHSQAKTSRLITTFALAYFGYPSPLFVIAKTLMVTSYDR